MNKDTQQKKPYIYWPLLIAAATPLAYFYAFTYEEGYASYFRMPQELISLSLTTIIINLKNYLLALLMLFLLINLLYMITASWFSKVFQSHNMPKLFASILAFFFLATNIYSRGFDNTTLILIGMYILLIFVGYILPLLLQNIRSSHQDIVSNTQAVDDDVPDVIVLLKNKYGAKAIFNIFMYFLILILIPHAFIYGIGYRSARIQENYLVITSNNEAEDIAAIKIYDEIVVVSPFDRSTKEVYPEFFVVDMVKLDSTMKLESIGPLIPMDR